MMTGRIALGCLIMADKVIEYLHRQRRKRDLAALMMRRYEYRHGEWRTPRPSCRALPAKPRKENAHRRAGAHADGDPVCRGAAYETKRDARWQPLQSDDCGQLRVDAGPEKCETGNKNARNCEELAGVANVVSDGQEASQGCHDQDGSDCRAAAMAHARGRSQPCA